MSERASERSNGSAFFCSFSGVAADDEERGEDDGGGDGTIDFGSQFLRQPSHLSRAAFAQRDIEILRAFPFQRLIGRGRGRGRGRPPRNGGRGEAAFFARDGRRELQKGERRRERPSLKGKGEEGREKSEEARRRRRNSVLHLALPPSLTHCLSTAKWMRMIHLQSMCRTCVNRVEK